MKNGWFLKQINESLTSASVVADTVKQSQKFAEECNKDSITGASDVDVLVIAFGCLDGILESINVCIEVGLYAKSSLKYLDVKTLLNKLGKDLY